MTLWAFKGLYVQRRRATESYLTFWIGALFPWFKLKGNNLKYHLLEKKFQELWTIWALIKPHDHRVSQLNTFLNMALSVQWFFFSKMPSLMVASISVLGLAFWITMILRMNLWAFTRIMKKIGNRILPNLLDWSPMSLAKRELVVGVSMIGPKTESTNQNRWQLVREQEGLGQCWFGKISKRHFFSKIKEQNRPKPTDWRPFSPLDGRDRFEYLLNQQ